MTDDHAEMHDLHAAAPDDDQWFVHTPDEPHAQEVHGRVNEGLVGGTLLVIIVGTGLVIALFVGYVPRLVHGLQVERQEQSDGLVEPLRLSQQAWDRDLTAKPAVVAEEVDGEATERLRIPWEMAKRAVIQDYVGGESN